MFIINLALGSLAAKFGRVHGNNPDDNETFPAWAAWRMSGALISVGVGYALRERGTAVSAIAGFSTAFLVVDTASKAIKGKR